MIKLAYIFSFFTCLLTSAYAQDRVLESGIDKLVLSGCVIQNNAIRITGTGNIQNNRASFSSETTLEEMDIVFTVTLVHTGAEGNFRFGMGSRSWLSGTMIEFAGNTDSTHIIVNRVDNDKIIFVKNFVFPIRLQEGSTYTIRLARRQRTVAIEVTDGVNKYYNDSLHFPETFFGLLWGAPFINAYTGEIAVKSFSITTPFPAKPLLAVWGDSIIEGNSLPDEKSRYASLLKMAIGHNRIALLGRGGESTTGMATRFTKELDWFGDATYALITLGANDKDFEIWRTNMLAYIAMVKQKGMVPIIVTLTPRYDVEGRIPFINKANDWIRKAYKGKYIDMNAAVTTDGEQWKPGYMMPDKVHPTPIAHLAMFDRIKQDAPYLFEYHNQQTQ